MKIVRFNQTSLVSPMALKYVAWRWLLAVAVVAAVSGNAAAQSIYGSIRGLVMDPASAAIPNAKVTLTNEGTAAQRGEFSNSLGEYVFNQVIPGTYTLGAEAPGFKKFERRNIVLETQNQLTVDLRMQVGDVAESVLVTAETPLIDTATASQGQVIDNRKLLDLPNIGRNPFMMSKLAPPRSRWPGVQFAVIITCSMAFRSPICATARSSTLLSRPCRR